MKKLLLLVLIFSITSFAEYDYICTKTSISEKTDSTSVVFDCVNSNPDEEMTRLFVDKNGDMTGFIRFHKNGYKTIVMYSRDYKYTRVEDEFNVRIKEESIRSKVKPIQFYLDVRSKVKIVDMEEKF